MAGRKGKYNQGLVEALLDLLRKGNTDADACARVGISAQTFHVWQRDKPEFHEMVTRARVETRELAVKTLRSAMEPFDQQTITQETFTETRLNRRGEPYQYTRTKKTAAITKLAADWRAALEYLKRRDPDNWSEHLVIKLTPEQAEVLKRHGLDGMQAMRQLINALDEEDVNVNA